MSLGWEGPRWCLHVPCHLPTCAPHLHPFAADGGVPYRLVLPFPKRTFRADDLPQQLHSLGLQPRQLLLLEPLGGGAGGGGGTGWSLRGALGTAASYFNPYSYLRGGAAGTPREQAAAAAAEEVQASASAAAAGTAARGQGAAPDALLPSGGGGGGGQQRGARKRALGGAPAAAAAGPNIHTLGSSTGTGREDGQDDPGANKYWNGNSTEFGGPPPPPGEQ